MTARPQRALVVGGSLGGLFAAHLLLREGWEVEVFEQAREPLAGRGAGIITHPELFDCLARIGIGVDESFGVEIPGRVTFDRAGNEIAALELPQFLTTWGRLHGLLLAAFPASRYRLGHELVGLEQDAGAVTARFANGAAARGELLVGADGIRSRVRALLAPEARPRYAGYVAWRGLAEERRLSPATHRALFPRFAFCLPPREHMLGYPVAGFTGSTRAGERCYNFVWYRPADESRELPLLCTDVHGTRHDLSVPPPLVHPARLAEMRRAAERTLSPQFVEVVRHAARPFFQAIFDLASTRIAFDRIALLGDAAFVARPHAGMGVTKAAGDAMALADSLRACGGDVVPALQRYQAARVPFGTAVVDYARALGAWLEGVETEEARRHHTPQAVMEEIAVERDFGGAPRAKSAIVQRT
jgi:2-polyprenyl-6-methoxyphenol hydroxylase-like FAD-dependent oxidoreductase